MYKSRDEIQRKLRQAQFAFRQLARYEGRIFVNSGLDETTGAYPFLYDFCSFVTQTRSVFQYGFKEAKARSMQRSYEDFVRERPIVKFFANIRDEDVHEYSPRFHTAIKGFSPITNIDLETGVGVGAECSMYVESLEDLDNPKARNTEVEVRVSIARRVEVNPQLIQQWTTERRSDLLDLARTGKPILELLEHQGERDIFVLSRSFLACADEFLAEGVKVGFIT